MITKKALDKLLLCNSFSDPFQVKFWDGEVISYGEGPPRFIIYFNTPIAATDLLMDPFITLGEGYMRADIEIDGDLQEIIQSMYNNKNSFLNQRKKSRKVLANTVKDSKKNVYHHYDIGNDFYQLWLDESMTYSCAYFRTLEDTLAQAQNNKIRHILKKLYLQEGQTLLDIGCGWGDLILTAAELYKTKALGITLSTEQLTKVKERIRDRGLEDLVDVQIADYRELKGMEFDRIVSVGMLEHVGKDNLKDYFSAVDRLLKDGGVSLLHTITRREEKRSNSWLTKYIFPGGYLPSVQELVYLLSNYGFHLLDTESLRRHYARTLELWANNFENAIADIRKIKDETFIRMWRLYLNASAVSFRCGDIDIHQFLLTKGINDDLPWTRDYMYEQ